MIWDNWLVFTLSWWPVPLGDALAPQGLCSMGGAKDGKEPTDGNEVDQEKQNEGCEMPHRRLTVDLKL